MLAEVTANGEVRHRCSPVLRPSQHHGHNYSSDYRKPFVSRDSRSSWGGLQTSFEYSIRRSGSGSTGAQANGKRGIAWMIDLVPRGREDCGFGETLGTGHEHVLLECWYGLSCGGGWQHRNPNPFRVCTVSCLCGSSANGSCHEVRGRRRCTKDGGGRNYADGRTLGGEGRCTEWCGI